MLLKSEQYKAVFLQVALFTELCHLYRDDPETRHKLLDGVARLCNHRNNKWWYDTSEVSMADMVEYILSGADGKPRNTLRAYTEDSVQADWVGPGFKEFRIGHRDDNLFLYIKDGKFYDANRKLLRKDQLPPEAKEYKTMLDIETKLAERFSYADMKQCAD